MRSVLTLAVASSLAVGCANPKHALMAADAAVMAAGIAVRVATDPNNCDAPDLGAAIGCASRGIGGAYAGYALIAVGALLLAGTAVFYPDPPAAAPPSERVAISPVPPPVHAIDTSPVGKLVQRASLEARAGHCYEVHEIANAIDKLDRTVRERELVKDTAIAMCLD